MQSHSALRTTVLYICSRDSGIRAMVFVFFTDRVQFAKAIKCL